MGAQKAEFTDRPYPQKGAGLGAKALLVAATSLRMAN